MNDYIEAMKNQIAAIRKAIKSAEKDKTGFPEGHMRISQTKKQIRYYHVTTDDYSGDYISQKNRELISSLAQKEYNESFLKAAKIEISRLERSIHLLSELRADQVYQELDPRRRKYVTPYILTDELYAAQWKDQPYKSNPYMPENKIYDTQMGEKVRSKSEAILADMFCELNIPYRYEQAVILKDRTIRYPDFTLLKVSSRQEIYLEHFGLLDDDEYRNNCLNKLNEYRNSGIYPGKNLLITYESNECPFDIKGTRRMIKDFFL